MKVYENFDSVSAADEKKRLVPGGYVCKITSVSDVPEKEYLKLEYDIADGSFKGYWSDNEENYGWRDSFIRSYKDKAIGFFKQFTNSVEQSNPGYFWKWDEKTLVGKLVGLVLGEEEYEKRDGSIGTRLRVSRVETVENIRSGNFSIPAKKTVTPSQKPSVEASTDDLPFDFD